MTDGLKRLQAVMDQVDSTDWEEGLVAYERYRTTMLSFAQHYSFTLAQVTGCFVALSPNNDYKGNIKSLATVLHGIRSGWKLEEIVTTTYNACRARAYLYANGVDFLSHAKGPKTRAFYQNILDPTDPSPVTVDGHMTNIWLGTLMTMSEVVRARAPYNSVAHDIRAVAFSRLLRGCQCQAMLWFAWKRINNVVYSPQLSIFRAGDQWGTQIDPAGIKPFPRSKTSAE
jgi:hypothetical protein